MLQGFYPTSSVTFGFPGSDIPEWFSYRSIGTSVTVRLPQQWHHPKFLGFAFCIVVAFKESYDGSFFSIRCESDYQDLYCHLDGWYCGQKGKLGLSFNGSDHLFMLYDHSLYLMAVKGEEADNDTSFRFYAVDKDKKPLHCCTVKKCGVRLLFPYEDKSCSSALIQGCTSFENFDVINEDNGKPMEEEGTFTKRYRDDESCNRAESSGCEIGSSSEGGDPKRIKESSESNAGEPTRAELRAGKEMERIEL
ncbi:disease resistance-like protein DSC1 [Manihot esculenta]|uniref:disease resistance-like protein DSC1 n=1 Tax=Manihot esculenta TaxID=3983 RepID=UPI001CC80877|nr:disease resistance-like protein DSC1 [Manihot esculenta]